MNRPFLFTLAALTFAAGPLGAAPGVEWSFSAAGGTSSIWAGETVWYGSHRDSQLNWQSLWTAEAEATAQALWSDGTRVRLTGTYGMAGDGHMVDYDWLVSGTTDWSDRSISPDTRLELDWSAGLEADKPFARWRLGPAEAQVRAGASALLRQVKWTAYGGTFIYTNATWHDNVGSFQDGVKGITYLQTLPLVFVNAASALAGQGWSAELEAGAGLSLGIQDQDNHWLRSLIFVDRMGAAPAWTASGTGAVSLGGGWSVFLEGRALQVFPARGSTTTSGAGSGTVADAAGADFFSLSAFLGLRTALQP